MQFEAGNKINTTNLVDNMKTALNCLQTAVTDAGGTFSLNSAYRPPQYQAHLREVWDKWKLLKNNQDPECADLKKKVNAEFTKHGLLSTQRPAAISKHTQGLAIDVTLSLPISQFLNLADGCMLYRPLPQADPVHFIHKP